jgi:hypothetical protein
MPTSRPEKFISFPTENEPIFRYRRPSLKPARGAHFARIQTQPNSQYAIQKTGVNSGSGHADHQGAPAAIPFLRSPDPLQKIKKRSHFSPRGRHARVRGATRKNTAQCQFAMLPPGQSGIRAQPRTPRTPAVQSNPAEPAYFNAYARSAGPPEGMRVP